MAAEKLPAPEITPDSFFTVLLHRMVPALGKTPGKILEVLTANPHFTLPEVAESIGKSLSAVERAVAKLVKQGRLRRIDPDKGGHWEVTK